MSYESIAQRVASKASLAEFDAARALGHDNIDAYISAFRTLDAVYALAWEVERDAVHMAPRMIGGRRD